MTLIHFLSLLQPILHQLLRFNRPGFICPFPNPALNTDKLISFETKNNSISIRTGIFFVWGNSLIVAPEFCLGISCGVSVKVDFVIQVIIVAHTAKGTAGHVSKVVIFWKCENVICDFQVFDFFQRVSAAGIFYNIKTV